MVTRLAMDVERRLLRDMGRAIGDHRLIESGDRILVAMSGGKDSYAMCVLLRDLQARAPVRFDLLAVHLDQGQPGYDGTPLASWLAAEGIQHKLLHENTYAIVTDKLTEGSTYCSLCSRLRRGILYSAAANLGCNKIALGHHRDDALETLLLNLFFGGKLAPMPPRLVTDDGRFVVIRPLAYAAESDIAAFAEERKFPILPLPAVRIAGERAAQTDEGAARGPRAQAPDSARDDARDARQPEPVAPLRPEAAGASHRGRRAGRRGCGSASPGQRARAMTANVAAGLTGLLAVALAAGCGNDSLGGGGPPTQLQQVAIAPADLSTGVSGGEVWINGPDDVTSAMVSSIAPQIRIVSFPGDVVVPATPSVVTTPRTVSPNGVPVPALAQIHEDLDAGLDGSGWYAVSLPASSSQYLLTTDWWLFAFEGGRRGIRWSPTHPPVVASVMSCHKDAGAVTIIVRYSEPVNKAAGLPSVAYGATPVACSASADEPGETQFICAGEDSQPFSLHLPDGMTAQASGRPMAPATLDSTGMQVSAIPNDACTVYKPLTVN